MQSDQIEFFGSSQIQHGPANNRVYLIKLNKNDLPDILAHVQSLALHNGYTKIFAKVPASALAHFEEDGYMTEASVPNFFKGCEDGFFMSRYFDQTRMIDPDAQRVRKVLQKAQEKAMSPDVELAESDLHCRLATPHDCEQMSALYDLVFKSYPFPIHNPDYLLETMSNNVVYAGVWRGNQLLALASAEVDRKMANSEMTDFATHPDCRGGGLATVLLAKLEGLIGKTGVKTCYTIARATSFGMNVTFARSGYNYSGTLIRNTQIAGSLESMNIWYKHLANPLSPAHLSDRKKLQTASKHG